MLHLRTARRRHPFDGLAGLLNPLWDHLVATDPGLLRLMMALRGTLAVAATTLTTVLAARLLGANPIEMAPGIMLTLMSVFLIREPTRRQRQRTLLLLSLPAAAAAVVTTLLHDQGQMGDGFFLVLVFVCFLLQARSPEAIAEGLVAVIVSYVGLYLELPPSTIGMQLLSIALAVPVTWLVSFVLLPLRPAVQLRRMVQAVRGRAAGVLHDARFSPNDPAALRRLRRSLARLNEAALAADDQLALLDPVGSVPTRMRLMDLELAAGRLAALPPDAVAGPARQAARLAVHERRLRRSRWRPRELAAANAPPRSPAAAALAEIARAAAALGEVGVGLTGGAPPSPSRPPPGPLAWRIALRVSLASALAMLGGMAISPQRWFWAVISTYVVFLNTRSRGDTVFRGGQRVAGTLLGLLAGLVVVSLLPGSGWTLIALLFLSTFGMYYFFLVSYTLGIFWVTILLGLVYQALGAPAGPLLVLRLEETAVGAAAAMVVAVLVLPVRTRDQVARSGTGVLRALAGVMAACSAALAGEAAPPVVVAMRAVDRQMADLRLALMPYTAGRFVLRRSGAERPIPALLDCVHWARVLAVCAVSPNPADSARAAAIAERLSALAGGERRVFQPLPRPQAAGKAAAALDRLDQATAILAERLTIGDLQGFYLER